MHACDETAGQLTAAIALALRTQSVSRVGAGMLGTM